MEKDKREELMNKLSRAWDEIMSSSEERRIRQIWQSSQKNTLTQEEDKRLAKILREHKEFHNYWESSHTRQTTKTPEGVNPFLHVSLHLIIENQLARNNPSQVYKLYLREIDKEVLRHQEIDKEVLRHQVIHRIAAIFSEILFASLKYRKPFNRKKYLQLLEEEIQRES